MPNFTLWIKHLLKPAKQLTCEEKITCIYFLIGYVEYSYWHRNEYFERNTLLKCVSPKHSFLYSKNYQNTVVPAWERRKRVICIYFVGLMTRITTLPSKLIKITLACYKEIPLMFFVCIPLGFAAWFPVQTEILFTCKSYQVFFKFFHFVCISVHFFLHR